MTRLRGGLHLAIVVHLIGCGGEVHPSNPASDGAPRTEDSSGDSIEGQSDALDSDVSTDQAAVSDAEVSTDRAAASDTNLPCQTQNADGGLTALQYADWLCEAIFVCTDGDAGDIGGACFVSVSESLMGKSPTGCVSACLAILGPIQSATGPACQGLSLDNPPPECVAAFQ
jgi:hypothetical protein